MISLIRCHIVLFVVGMFVFSGSVLALDLGGALKQMQQAVHQNEQQNKPASVSTEEINVGYLKKTLKTYDGAGCTYILASDDKKGGEQPTVAANDYEYKGMVLNINSQDVLVVGSNDVAGQFTGSFNGFQVTIPAGKNISCGEECSKALTNINITKSGFKKSVAVVGYCGS